MIELISTFVLPLDRVGLRYLVTGSVAAMAYGEPRLTNGIDLILAIKADDINSLLQAFPEADYYLPPVEVILSEQARALRGHFNIIHHGTLLKADVYLAGSDPLHQWAFDHALRMEVEAMEVVFAPPEYVMIRKLEFHREGGSEKHLRDIAAMINELGPEIDMTFLVNEVRARGLLDSWQRANAITQT